MAVKNGKCGDHQPEHWVSSRDKTPTQRGYGYKWVKIRKRILMRDGYLCQECLRNDIITQATDVDHILNKKRGGTDDASNLESLCKACHERKTLKERNE